MKIENNLNAFERQFLSDWLFIRMLNKLSTYPAGSRYPADWIYKCLRINGKSNGNGEKMISKVQLFSIYY